MAYVQIDLDEFDFDEIIDYVEENGYRVRDNFTAQEVNFLLDMLSSHKPGTEGYFLYEKIKGMK